jgi:hypothetical protein
MEGLTRRATVALLLLALGMGTVPAQKRYKQDTGSRGGRRVAASLTPDDPVIPAPDELSIDTDSRLFVDSFLVALFREDLEKVYDTYLHSMFTEIATKEAFVEDVAVVRQVVGSLERLVVTYLREDRARYDGADGGWSNHHLIFERDPQVKAHVEFRRAGNGLWKVVGYSIQSAQADRLHRAREASRRATEAEKKEAGSEDDPGSR